MKIPQSGVYLKPAVMLTLTYPYLESPSPKVKVRKSKSESPSPKVQIRKSKSESLLGCVLGSLGLVLVVRGPKVVGLLLFSDLDLGRPRWWA